MGKKLPVDELLRLACIYAESDQREFAAAVQQSDPNEFIKAVAFVEQIREYRIKRWGRTKLEAEMDGCKSIPVNEAIRRFARESADNHSNFGIE